MRGDEDSRGVDFENLRRLFAWISTAIFAASFVGLLTLSATPFWIPDNPWILFLDGAWRISGAVGLCLWLLPRLAGATRWLGRLFLGDA